MLKKLYPNQYISSIFKLDLEHLKEQGIKGIMFDIDNTLVPYDVEMPTPEIIDLFEKIQSEGFKISLVSNNNETRVVRFNEHLKVFAIHKSKKPSTRSFVQAMKLMDLGKEQVAIVGDQIFTDVYGGNRTGIHTVLVKPVSDKDELITKVKRGIERRVIGQYEKRNQQHNR
ncbi:MAG: YqeG family HAD IIIA-type phosphatase [Cellulosilyticaceae bacterium]